MDLSSPQVRDGCFPGWNFEFFDVDWLPLGMRRTLHELLTWYNGAWRGYYAHAASAAASLAAARGCQRIVELGAGHGPVTSAILKLPPASELTCIVSDLKPDLALFHSAPHFPADRVTFVSESVDFSIPHTWPPCSLLLLCGVFHHVPPGKRLATLEALQRSGEVVFILEPVRRHWLSLLCCPLVIMAGFLLPLGFGKRKGLLRRILWCWVLPAVPLMFFWDSVISCLRQCPETTWRRLLRQLDAGRPTSIVTEWFETRIVC